MLKNSKTYFIIFFCLVAPLTLLAQEGYEHLSPIAHGAGRTYVVTSRGLAAVGLNPALLDFDNNNTIEIQIFPISGYGLDAGPSFSDANALSGIFNGIGNAQPVAFGVPRITDSALTSIANLLSNGKLSGRGDAEILGVSYRLPDLGTFAFTWTTHAALRTDIPQSFLDFAQSAESKLIQEANSIDNFDFQGMWYSEYSLSFGKNLNIGPDTSMFFKSISFGGAIKYVSGIAYLKVDQGNYIHTKPSGGQVDISVNFDEHSAYSSSFDPTHAPNHFSFGFLTNNQAGSGIGLDLGFCAGLLSNKHGTPTVLLALSATDIGTISWTKNATERIADHLEGVINYGTASSIKAVTDSLKKFQGTLKNLSSFSTPLPAMFRAGMQFDLDAMGIEFGTFAPKIAVEYANGLTGLVGSLKTGRFGAGLTLEQTGNIGLRLGGGFVIESNANDITLGVGITIFKFLNIDIASGHVGQFFKSGSKRTDIALGIRAAF